MPKTVIKKHQPGPAKGTLDARVFPGDLMFSFTPQKGHDILKLIRAGADPMVASVAKGIAKDTFRLYRSRAEEYERTLKSGDPNRKHYELAMWFREIEQAVAESEVVLVIENRTGDSMIPDVKDADGKTIKRYPVDKDMNKWTLSKRFGERWGGRSSIELSGPDGGPIKQEIDASLTVGVLILPQEEIDAVVVGSSVGGDGEKSDSPSDE